MSATTDSSCYTLVYEDSSEAPTTQELRTALQKGSDEVKLDTLRKIIISTINGNHQVRLRAARGVGCKMRVLTMCAGTRNSRNC